MLVHDVGTTTECIELERLQRALGYYPVPILGIGASPTAKVRSHVPTHAGTFPSNFHICIKLQVCHVTCTANIWHYPGGGMRGERNLLCHFSSHSL